MDRLRCRFTGHCAAKKGKGECRKEAAGECSDIFRVLSCSTLVRWYVHVVRLLFPPLQRRCRQLDPYVRHRGGASPAIGRACRGAVCVVGRVISHARHRVTVPLQCATRPAATRRSHASLHILLNSNFVHPLFALFRALVHVVPHTEVAAAEIAAGLLADELRGWDEAGSRRLRGGQVTSRSSFRCAAVQSGATLGNWADADDAAPAVAVVPVGLLLALELMGTAPAGGEVGTEGRVDNTTASKSADGDAEGICVPLLLTVRLR